MFAQIPKGNRSAKIYSMYDFAEVTGVLHVRLIRDESGVITSVYDMDVENTRRISS